VDESKPLESKLITCSFCGKPMFRAPQVIQDLIDGGVRVACRDCRARLPLEPRATASKADPTTE
jgi:hypothetical protein